MKVLLLQLVEERKLKGWRKSRLRVVTEHEYLVYIFRKGRVYSSRHAVLKWYVRNNAVYIEAVDEEGQFMRVPFFVDTYSGWEMRGEYYVARESAEPIECVGSVRITVFVREDVMRRVMAEGVFEE